jgi:hypothetical protein
MHDQYGMVQYYMYESMEIVYKDGTILFKVEESLQVVSTTVL